MSLADEVRTVRQRVVTRLNELEPLVREYEELLLLAGELGITVPEPAAASAEGDQPQADQPAAAESERLGSSARSGAGRRRRGRGGAAPDAPDPRRDALLLETLQANPGATTAELASLLGVPATSLYRPVRDLTSSGAIVKRGRGLYAAA